MARKCIDLTGMKFGRLTVIERAENKGKKPCWLCKCECGNEKVVRGSDLRGDKVVSCGCYNREKTKKRNEENWKDEEYRKKQSEKSSETIRKQWQDDSFRKMQSEKMKKQWQDDNYRQMKSERQTGNKNPYWKGGITFISHHLRELNSQWFEDCKQQANYICQLTGKSDCKLHTHHLKAFNIIVKEAHDLYGIEVKPQIKDYTDEELKILEKYVASWHKDNSNAVVLCKDVHMLFHQEYGYRNNTPEQYMEFKERYLAGEFKEILK